MLKKFAVAILSTLIALLPLSGVARAATVGTNLIANGNVETATAGSTTAPSGWTFESYDDTSVAGSGTTTGITNTWTTTGHTGRGLEAKITGYVDGDVTWATAAVPVTASTSYQFTDWYKSDATTEIDAAITFATAASMPADTGCDAVSLTCFVNMATVPAATTWTQGVANFTTPAGATTVQVYHLLAANGTLDTDDYSLTTYIPTPFNKAMVSVTFDDGWINQYTNAAPYMQTKGLIGTFYIISGASVTAHDDASNLYMNSTQVKDLYTKGNEIGSHSVNHCDLANSGAVDAANTTANCPVPLPDANVLSEMSNSKTALQNLTGSPVTDFAYPYGAYNAHTISVGQSLGYLSQRSVNPGYNTKDGLDATQLKMYEVDNTTTTAEVEGWMNEAVAQHTWLILCYHEVADTPADPGDLQYSIPVKNFQDQMDFLANLKTAGSTDVLTVAQALKQAQGEISGTTVTPPASLAVSAVNATPSSDTTASINWLSNLAANSQVKFGLDATYGSTSTLDTTLVTTHQINLTGLTAGTTYHYQVLSVDGSGNTVQSSDMTFLTLLAGAPGDINRNGRVDDDDATLMYANWGQTGVNVVGDITHDGVVNDNDATVMYANWSK
jgi:peptidoglycan/xylan/chitin deacetylase (PgdA/CDA1 family)